jgi:DNA-binding transcriptional LysR family regulator
LQIDFLGIQAFLAVAESGSFALAAARLHLSQTAISHRMRKLEESLGVELVVRTSRGIALTEAANALLPRARTAVQQLEDSFEHVRRHRQDVTRWVAFGCLPTLAASILVPLLGEAAERFPHVQVRLFDSSPVEIAELVQAGTAAFGLTIDHGVPPRLQVEPIAREPFVLVCPAGHPLATRDGVQWPDLLGQPLIRISLPSGNSMTIDDALGPLREQLRWRYEAQRTAVAVQMVRGGLGVTVVPQLSVQAGDGIAVVPIAGPAITRVLGLVTRAGNELRAEERFLADRAADLLRERLGPAAP